MRLLLVCLAILILVIAVLGSGVLNPSDGAPGALPAGITRWWAMLQPVADQYQVDPLFVAAVMMQESGGNPGARSSAGANGLMQVLDGPFDPQLSIERGVRILAGHLQTFKDKRVALAAYNAGPGLSDEGAANNPALRYAGVRGAARQAGVPVGEFDKYSAYLPGETRRYVPAVMAYYERFTRAQFVNTYEGAVRYPLDKFTWYPTFGKHTGNGQEAHTGEDLIAPCGTAVKAAFNGEIVYRGCLYGNCKDGGVANGATGHGLVIVEQFEANKYAVYAHLGSYVSDKMVKAGDVVGFIGMTGWTMGCHLHFAIWQGTLDDMLKGNGKNWQDPKKYFPNAYQRPAAMN